MLALFVAPVLLDAAYDASLRDLLDNWAPVTSLVLVAVGLTTAAVAVSRTLSYRKCRGRPRLRWARSWRRPMRSPQPPPASAPAAPSAFNTILEGESLLNDASALLIYRVAVGAAAVANFLLQRLRAHVFCWRRGSLIAGWPARWLR